MLKVPVSWSSFRFQIENHRVNPWRKQRDDSRQLPEHPTGTWIDFHRLLAEPAAAAGSCWCTGTSCYQLGRNVKAAMQNTHLAAALEAGSVGGLLNQRVRKR